MKHAYLFLAAILALIAGSADAMDYDVGPIHIAQYVKAGRQAGPVSYMHF
jgi:hypothetical protein